MHDKYDVEVANPQIRYNQDNFNQVRMVTIIDGKTLIFDQVK